MMLLFLFVGLLTQSLIIHCSENDLKTKTVNDLFETEPPKIQRQKADLDPDVKSDFFFKFFGSNKDFYPTPSAVLMSQITNSEKPAQEQIDDIKAMASTIDKTMVTEMTNLLKYVIGEDRCTEKNNVRTRRSTETPMDSTEMVMRLLRHIKNNNENQIVAIEKMMSAQEIADKFGIKFEPDLEIWSDLAMAAQKQTEEITEILKEVCNTKNATEKLELMTTKDDNVTHDNTYYKYTVQDPQPDLEVQLPVAPIQEYTPEQINRQQRNQNQHHHQKPQHTHFETQVVPPPVHHHPQAHMPVTPRPNFYEQMVPLNPSEYCPQFEPISATFMTIEEFIQPEPELVGEEIEETVSSKMFVESDEEPGLTTVNHVTTYTVSEKQHFRLPQIEKLPQQIQYSFFMM